MTSTSSSLLNDNFTCAKCSKTNLYNAFRLSCNRHSLCCLCFGKTAFSDGTPFPTFVCPACNEKCTSFTVMEKTIYNGADDDSMEISDDDASINDNGMNNAHDGDTESHKNTGTPTNRFRTSAETEDERNLDTEEYESPTKKQRIDYTESEKIDLPQPHFDKDPVHHFQHSGDVLLDFLRLSMTYYIDEGTKIRASSVDLPLKKPSIMLDDKKQEALETFFVKLHTIIFNHDKHDERESSCLITSNSLTPANFKALADNDRSLLHRCLTSLCTGKKLQDIRNDNEMWKKMGRASFVAADILRAVTHQKPCFLQEAMNQVAMIHGFPHAAHQFLTSLGICGSRESIRIQDINKVNEKIVNGWRFIEKKWCVVIVVYDNVGFKIKGKKRGYDQYTGIQVLTISKKRLQDAGFYKPRDSEEEPISRVRKEWKNEWKNIRPKDLMANEEDYRRLSERTCQIIDWILHHCNELPTIDQVTEMLKLSDRNDISWKTKIKTEFGSRRRHNVVFVHNEVDDDEVNIHDEEGFSDSRAFDHEEVATTANRKATDDAEYEIPMKADLNASSTVKALMDYCRELRALIQKEVEKDEENGVDDEFSKFTSEKPLIDALGIFMAGDGSPAYLFHRLKDADPELYKDVQNFCGAFHFMLEILKMRGKEFASSHLADMIHGFRKGEKAKKWVLEPGDPTQALDEMYEAVAALIVKACRETAAKKMGPITTIDVWDHMVMCACQDPTEFVLLMEMRFVEIITMICDSEKTSDDGCDPALFRSAMRLGFFLLATTNCFKYVQIVAEFLIWWHCASEADRIIWEKFIFTHDTKNGKKIFLDRFMEWLIKDVREVLGKYASGRMHDRLTLTLMNMKERKLVKSELSTSAIAKNNATTTTSKSSTETDISDVFCHTLAFAHKIKLWECNRERCTSSGAIRNPSDFLDTSGKIKLNKSVISLISIAEKRIEKYLEKFYFTEELHQLYRPPRDINLRTVPMCHSAAEEEDNRKVLWRSSMNAKDLNQFGKDALRNNHSYLNSQIQTLKPDAILIDPCPSHKNLDKHADVLVQVRKQIRDIDAEFTFDEPDGWVDMEIEPDNSDLPSKMKIALEHPFFKICDEVRDEYDNKDPVKLSIEFREEGMNESQNLTQESTQSSTFSFSSF